MSTHAERNACEEPLLWDIATTQRQLGGIARGSVDRLVRRGQLVRVKVGRRSLITRESVVRLIEACRAI